MIKRISLVFLIVVGLAACGGGDSDSGAMVEPTLPGTNVPASFAGTYRGTLTITAQALTLTETDTFDITITVTEDAMVRFDGDDPDETFTVGLSNDGTFAGNFDVNEDECTGSLATTGRVDGTTASGDVSGEGRCDISGLSADVTLTGTFTATK